MTPQPSRPGDLGLRRGVDLRALSGVDEGLLDERADAQRGGELLARGQGHLLGGVVGAEAVPGLAAATGPAVPADGAPVEDDEVARGDVGDALADGLDDPGGLVAEQEREVVVDAALAVVQVGVADAAGLDLDHRLTRPRVGHHDRLHRYRVALLVRDDPTNQLRHGCTHSRCGARRASGVSPGGRRIR
jgi:hypothetical protein